MLYLIQSNQLESLFKRLLDVIAEPLKDPFFPETIVVQNPGMARWLSQQIALQKGIAANYNFPLPARFIWQVYASQLEVPNNKNGFDYQVMLWRILSLLTDSSRETQFGQINSYLDDDPDGQKAFHLSARIADLFDQYLVYRPDILLEWESGGTGDWQAVLWRKLTVSGQPHRARLLHLFREKYHAGSLKPDTLPQRISIFGLSTLAPVYLEIVDAVSSMIDVYLFHLNPCRQYWADLASETEMAKRRRIWRRRNQMDVSGYFETGNPLLAFFGQVGQDFSNQLASLEFDEDACYEEPAGDSLLASLQQDILELNNRADSEAEQMIVSDEDCSVQFHACYSRLREVQVLHDRLLDLFASDTSLKPNQILVMAPDIEAYAFAVRAVFESTSKERFIPWSLADRSFLGENPIAEAFFSLLDLSVSRCTAPDVMAFLEFEAVLRKLQIDKEGLATIRRWVRESNIRWGIDQNHRQVLGQNMTDLHSWSFGLKRLLLGYFGGSDAPIFHEIVPCCSISAEDAILLGRFAEFLDRLQLCCQRLQGKKTPEQWADVLLKILEDFFDPGHNEDDQQSLVNVRETVCRFLDHCRDAGFAGKINQVVIQAYFKQELSSPSGKQSFLTGRVTFCNMVPMRSVPFKVICLLGMNDADYPRRQNTVSFDIIAGNPVIGDRNRRNDDLYLFLEALISARYVFYISWIGRDQQDNSRRLPSVAVSELIEYIRRGYRLASGPEFIPRITEHSLQPFSRRCFDGSIGWRSYAKEWLPGTDPVIPDVFLSTSLPAPEEEWRTVDIRQLKRFWSHPVRFFLQERLGLELRE
ncbi:MAG: exodeoxyribonuclease V subunit gamma, partial [Desulfobulbales bacterium]